MDSCRLGRQLNSLNLFRSVLGTIAPCRSFSHKIFNLTAPATNHKYKQRINNNSQESKNWIDLSSAGFVLLINKNLLKTELFFLFFCKITNCIGFLYFGCYYCSGEGGYLKYCTCFGFG